MIELTQWCSLYCDGTEAIGDVEVTFEHGSVSLPVCADCLQVLQENPDKALDLTPGAVLELDEDQTLPFKE